MAAHPFNRVLILSASAGAGHMRAADALEHAFKKLRAAANVRHLDVLQLTNKLFRRLYSKAYLDLVNSSPELLGWFYDYLDTPWKHDQRRLILDKLNTRPFVKFLHEFAPDMIVCTHFLPAEIVSWLKAERRLTCPQAIVVTDLDVHAMWLCRNYEHYFVSLEETREHLMKLGVPAGKVTVSGIPIDPVFAQKKNQREMRRKHGLQLDVTTILLSAGGFGVGPVEHLLQALLEMKHHAQVVAVCGRNEELKTRIEEMNRHRPRSSKVTIKPIGFTSAMDEYMSAADIIVGKPGGLTTAEALAKGLLLVIVNPIPGQEERNSDHFLESGVAIRCNNLPVLAYKIDELLGDRKRLATMRANVKRIARPNAAQDIVKKLFELKQ
jgi:processive 1,2-diacylglycerol beta-glucosyltransferase